MSDALPIPAEAIMAAARAAHEAERAVYVAEGEETPSWDEAVADSTCWAGENFTLEEVLGFQEAAIRAAFEEMGLRVVKEGRTTYADNKFVGRWRLVADWVEVPDGCFLSDWRPVEVESE
jgi:8-oxo-dGTP pyrophosphatase MutT (NUDIX family)